MKLTGAFRVANWGSRADQEAKLRDTVADPDRIDA